MKNEIKEISKLPSFIFVLFGIQLIIFLYLIIKTKSEYLEIFYILLPVTIILLVLKLTVVIDSRIFKYRLFPFHFGYKEIEWKEIEMVEISKIDALSDFMGWGLRYSTKYGWGYIFNSNDAILLTLKNGKKLVFTIKNKIEIMKFLTDNKIPFNIL